MRCASFAAAAVQASTDPTASSATDAPARIAEFNAQEVHALLAVTERGRDLRGRTKQTLWEPLAEGKKCTGQRFRLISVSSQQECQDAAVAIGHGYYQYRSRGNGCATVPECEPFSAGAWTVYSTPAPTDSDSEDGKKGLPHGTPSWPAHGASQRCNGKTPYPATQPACQEDAWQRRHPFYMWTEGGSCRTAATCDSPRSAGQEWTIHRTCNDISNFEDVEEFTCADWDLIDCRTPTAPEFVEFDYTLEQAQEVVDNCAQTCRVCEDTSCDDTAGWVGGGGFICRDWSGYPCNEAVSSDGYTDAEQQDLLNNCLFSCGLCRPN